METKAYTLQPWVAYITDVNECYINNPCEDICINTEGAYECSCSDNSEIVTEDGNCVGNEAKHLLYAV